MLEHVKMSTEIPQKTKGGVFQKKKSYKLKFN